MADSNGAQQQASSSSSSPFPPGLFFLNTKGTDPPRDPATAGFQLNHTMLRIRDPKPALNFYVNLMGMRTVFNMNSGPFTVYYLGYPNVSAGSDLNNFDLETWGTTGLLELCHIHGSETQAAGQFENNARVGFGHLGFMIPDVPATLERLRAAGVEVLKELGTGELKDLLIGSGPRTPLHPVLEELEKNVAFVRDPDGHLIELVPTDTRPPAEAVVLG